MTTAAEPTWDLTTMLLTASLAGTLTEAMAAALGPGAIVAFAMAMAGRMAGLLGAAATAEAACNGASGPAPGRSSPSTSLMFMPVDIKPEVTERALSEVEGFTATTATSARKRSSSGRMLLVGDDLAMAPERVSLC